MKTKIFDYRFQVKEQYLDSFGHVNNAAYLTLYEEARWQLITENGYGLAVVQEKKKGPVVLDVSIRFKRELLNREFVTIRSQTESVSGKIMRMKQTMVKDNGEIASEAIFTFGVIDMEKRRLIEPPVEWLRAIGAENED